MSDEMIWWDNGDDWKRLRTILSSRYVSLCDAPVAVFWAAVNRRVAHYKAGRPSTFLWRVGTELARRGGRRVEPHETRQHDKVTWREFA